MPEGEEEEAWRGLAVVETAFPVPCRTLEPP